MLKARDFKKRNLKLPQVFRAPPRPIIPSNDDLLLKTDYDIVETLQTFINQFEYNYTGTVYRVYLYGYILYHIFECVVLILSILFI